jgi:thiamine pyrophosphate-dependent acetolactate synthase large subunit-like protein
MNVAKIIYNKLLQHNVKDAFIYTGGAIMPLIDCFHKQNEANKINYFNSLV